MTQIFRKTVMATTMLAGFAIFAFDTAQAGPNGPSFSAGSISGFSSMRMDFNRVGGPGRALSRNDLRVVPIEIVKKPDIPKDEKPKDTKKRIAKKDTSPKSGNAGQGKNDVGNGPNLNIDPAIAEIYAVTGGNIGDVSGFGEWAERLKIGPLVVANPLFPAQDGGTFTPPEFPGGGLPKDEEQSDRNFIDGWPGYSGAPSRFPDPSGKVSEGGPTAQDHTRNLSHWWPGHAKDESTQATARGDTRNPYEWMPPKPKDEPTASSPRVFQPYDKVSDPKPDPVAFAKDPNETWYQPSEPKDEDEHEAAHANEQDSQPVEEGSGRPSNNGGGWCSPTGGCLRPARNNGSPRIIPAETDGGGTVSAHRQSPSWATDPSEYGYTGGGGGGGYTGYTPQDEEDGDNGGPGNPALEALNAAL